MMQQCLGCLFFFSVKLRNVIEKNPALSEQIFNTT